MPDSEMSAASFHALYERLHRSAQWGADDRRGALNHITPARLAAAAGQVRTGRTVTMAAPLAASAADNPEPGARHMKHLPGEPSEVAGLSFAADQLTMNVHGDVDSHIDALCHVSYDGALYNGVAPGAVTSRAPACCPSTKRATGSWAAACCWTSRGCAASAGSSPAIRSPPMIWPRLSRRAGLRGRSR